MAATTNRTGSGSCWPNCPGPIDAMVTLFPPSSSGFAKNTRIGRRLFINASCTFQDQGGVDIGDDCLIGHNVVIATLNHDMAPGPPDGHAPGTPGHRPRCLDRANATILPGVATGEDDVVAAAAVVTPDLPEGVIVVGSPARVVRTVRV